MADVREAILARLFEVISNIPNIRFAARNETDIPEDKLPAVLLFDADEEDPKGSDSLKVPPTAPSVMYMMPEIVIAQQSMEVGSDLTTLRVELIKRVVNDAQLNAAVGTTGGIRYIRCITDFGWGRSNQGALRAFFTFRYGLKPWEL